MCEVSGQYEVAEAEVYPVERVLNWKGALLWAVTPEQDERPI